MFTAIENVTSEFGQTLRRLLREWGFVVAFVLTLALGIGANGAVFTALHAYLLKPLPYPHAGRLVNVYLGARKLSFSKGNISAAAYKRLGKIPAIASSGLVRSWGTHVTMVIPGEQPRSLVSSHVTASVFTTLGVQPLFGRWIKPASNRPDGPSETVLSYRLWQSAFHGDHHVLGRTLRVNGKQYTIVGVMPQHFDFPTQSTVLWLPVVLYPVDFSMGRLTTINWQMIARLKPGVTSAAVNTQIKSAWTRLEQNNKPSAQRQLGQLGFYVNHMSWRQWMGGATTGHLRVMQWGAAALLLLAIASLANLALVRALRRREEWALRVVLGAGRTQVLLSSLLEALPLAVLTTLIAWPLAHLGTRAFVHFGIAAQDTAFKLSGSAGIWPAAFGIALVLSFAVLALPQLFIVRPRRPASLLYGGGRGAAGNRATRRLRKGLSTAQIALAILLLATASLLGLSLRNMLSPNPGFNARHLYVASLNLQGPQYNNWGGWHAANERLRAAVARISGVTNSAIGEGVPFTGTSSVGTFQPANEMDSGVPPHSAAVTLAGPDLLRTMDLRLVSGRLIQASDIATDAHVLVVDERFAKTLFGHINVVGKAIRSNGVTWRIVGVVGTIRDQFASHHATGSLTVFVPESHTAFNFWGGSTDILVRSKLSQKLLAKEIRSAVHQALPEQSLLAFQPMQTLIANSAQGTSALASLLIAFGLLAFVLASVGTYGVVAYLTRLRQREFAIRLVLGARPWKIEWMVLGQGIALWAFGAVLGIGLAFLFGRFLHGQLYGVSLLSPAAYIVPALVLGLVVVLASWLPARRVRRTALAGTLNPQ
ncbi:MAG: ABC transporter permease [Gammaproteobacteria bacterium]